MRRVKSASGPARQKVSGKGPGRCENTLGLKPQLLSRKESDSGNPHPVRPQNIWMFGVDTPQTREVSSDSTSASPPETGPTIRRSRQELRSPLRPGRSGTQRPGRRPRSPWGDPGKQTGPRSQPPGPRGQVEAPRPAPPRRSATLFPHRLQPRLVVQTLMHLMCARSLEAGRAL